MNTLSTIAAAVRTALADAPLSQTPASVQRVYVPPDYDSAATTELKLLVVAHEEEVDLEGNHSTRGLCDHVYAVKVALLKRVTAADVTSQAALEELDALSDLREELLELLKGLAEIGGASLKSVKNTAVYDPALLDQKKTFVSVIALTYRLLR